MLRNTFPLAVLAALLICAGSPAVAAVDPGDNDAMSEPESADRYYYSTLVDMSFDEAVVQSRAALKEIGFGILWETDFQAKMKEKLNQDIPPYMMLGACHPGLAYKVYELEEWIGILMPCNVVVREMADGTVEVAIKNSLMLPQATGNAELQPLVEEVDELTWEFISIMANASPSEAEDAEDAEPETEEADEPTEP